MTKNVELNDVVDEEWSEFLVINLKLKTSSVLQQADFWHMRSGICKSNLATLNQEFNNFRGLFPLKLFFTGPPGAGKTFYAEKLAASYGVPHIRISDVVQQGYSLETELGEELRKKAEEIKD